MNITPLSELTQLPVDAIVDQLSYLNTWYRRGEPMVSDFEYDQMRAVLASKAPAHEYLSTVEPESLLDGKGRVSHTNPMLSTDKAYTATEVSKWLDKVTAYAKENGIEDLQIRMTPKLDGCAGRYSPTSEAKFVTRGDGQFGNDFTPLGERCVFVGDDSQATVGELICDEAYYLNTLKAQGVKHPRNFVSGLLGADELSAIAQQALDDGAVRFVSYTNMDGLRVYSVDEFKAVLDDLETVEIEITSQCPYRTDGVVIQVHSDQMFSEMGNNGSFHYGQIAKKIAGEPTEVICVGESYQVGRTGRLSPVVHIEPTEIGGVMVSNITAHHAGNMKALSIGQGAVLLAIRSGDVIPKIVGILKPAENVTIPQECPVCSSETSWSNGYLVCQNVSCEGRIAAQLRFFTKTLGMDLIGTKASEKLSGAGIGCAELLHIDSQKLQSIGFGHGQSANIIAELERIKSFPVEDYKLLASVGISMLGNRASKALLKDTLLADITSITRDTIVNTEGFGDKKASVIIQGIETQAPLINALVEFFDDVKSSKIKVTESPITGKSIVFTGTMLQGARSDMTLNAEKLGAKVQSGVSSKTDYLVIGEKVGATKITKAEKHGVTVLTEQQYLDLLAG